MKAKEFFGKFCSLYLWGNLLAMVLVIVGLCLGVKYGLEAYTHHGEGIEVPALVNMRADNARVLLIEKGLELMVADSGYNKRLPADCILAQSPGAGTKVRLHLSSVARCRHEGQGGTYHLCHHQLAIVAVIPYPRPDRQQQLP